jgi:hypothetical protein
MEKRPGVNLLSTDYAGFITAESPCPLITRIKTSYPQITLIFTDYKRIPCLEICVNLRNLWTGGIIICVNLCNLRTSDSDKDYARRECDHTRRECDHGCRECDHGRREGETTNHWGETTSHWGETTSHWGETTNQWGGDNAGKEGSTDFTD